MSRKGKKRAKGKYRQPMRPAGPLTAVGTAGAQPATPTRSVSQARVGGDQALVRSVELSLGSRNQFVKQRGGRMIVQSIVIPMAMATSGSLIRSVCSVSKSSAQKALRNREMGDVLSGQHIPH